LFRSFENSDFEFVSDFDIRISDLSFYALRARIFTLGINAWQAMCEGGKFYLETDIVTLDDQQFLPPQPVIASDGPALGGFCRSFSGRQSRPL